MRLTPAGIQPLVRHGVGQRLVHLERLVHELDEQVAAVAVAAALGDEVDLNAAGDVHDVMGGDRDLGFLELIPADRDAGFTRVEPAIDRRAVDRPGVLERFRPGAVDQTGTAGDTAALRFRQDAGGHVDDREIAAAERQLVHDLAGDGGGHRRLAGVDHGLLAGDRDGLFEDTLFQDRVDGRGDADVDADLFLLDRLEARELKFQVIIARREVHETIVPLRRGDIAHRGDEGAGQRDADTGDNGTVVHADRAVDITGVLLGIGERNDQCTGEESK